MKFESLKVGDKLVCLRIQNDILVFIKLEITARAHYNFSVISDSLDTYTFTIPVEREINVKQIIVDGGGEILDNRKEYLFETTEDCKKFATEYCEKKIKTYEETIQRIKTW